MKKTCIAASMAALTMAQTASAQSLQDFENAGRTDMRASVGVTIPLGAASKARDTAPRVDFSVQSARIGQNTNFDHDVRRAPAIGWRPQRGSTLSLTLQDNPRLMLNGRKVATFGPTLTADEEDDDNKGGGVSPWLIGGGVALGLLAWATFETTDELEDLLVPD